MDSLENCKITGYAVSIKNLPDKIENQADWLKAQFDARTDDEVKQQHNALCELLKALGVEESVTSEDIRGIRVGTLGSLEWKDAQGAWHSLGTGGGVVSFAGRAGAVEPQAGDYTAADVGALPSEKATSLVPTGAVMPFAGANAPTGWLLCDGSAVPRTTYAALFAVIGTTYGSGDGASTFNLPDLRGRVAAGVDSDADLGMCEGERTKILSEQELPIISPTLENAHSIAVDAGVTVEQAGGGSKFAVQPEDLNSGYFYAPYSQYGSAAPGKLPGIASFGAGMAYNAMPPSLHLNYVIKV